VVVAVLVSTLVAAVAAITLVAAAVVAIIAFAVATVARMEGDNFLGSSRPRHDRRRATTQVGHSWCRLS
jgi:hypothetical protein